MVRPLSKQCPLANCQIKLLINFIMVKFCCRASSSSPHRCKKKTGPSNNTWQRHIYKPNSITKEQWSKYSTNDIPERNLIHAALYTDFLENYCSISLLVGESILQWSRQLINETTGPGSCEGTPWPLIFAGNWFFSYWNPLWIMPSVEILK